MGNLSLLIRRSFLYKYIAYTIKKKIVQNNPLKEIERCYKKAYGKSPNLQHPQNFVEKIYWMEWNTDTSLWTKCADKYRVREYLNDCGLGHIAPKLLGKWDSVDQIDFSLLPDEFIVKTNDGCGTNYIVKDKGNVDIRKIRKLFKRWLKIRQGYSNAQYHYLDIQPCIIAEELLKQSDDLNVYSPSSLVDYKIYCFNGEPECINIIYDRTDKSVKERLYDLDWNDISYNLINTSHFSTDNQLSFPKPKCLDEMLAMARILSKPFPQVRVDFYNIDNKPVFGELTFSSGYGDFTEDYINYLGSKIDLSKLKKISKNISNIKYK